MVPLGRENNWGEHILSIEMGYSATSAINSICCLPDGNCIHQRLLSTSKKHLHAWLDVRMYEPSTKTCITWKRVKISGYKLLFDFTHDNVSSDLHLGRKIFPQSLCLRKKKEPVEILISTPMGYHELSRKQDKPEKGHGGTVPILIPQLFILETQFTFFPWICLVTSLLYSFSSGAGKNVSVFKKL